MGRRRHGGRAIGPRLSRVTKAAGARPPAGAGRRLTGINQVGGSEHDDEEPGVPVGAGGRGASRHGDPREVRQPGGGGGVGNGARRAGRPDRPGPARGEDARPRDAPSGPRGSRRAAATAREARGGGAGWCGGRRRAAGHPPFSLLRPARPGAPHRGRPTRALGVRPSTHPRAGRGRPGGEDTATGPRGGQDRGPVPRSGERIGAGAPPRPARDDGGGGGGDDTGDGSGPRRAREASHTRAHGPGEQQTARGPRRTDGRRGAPTGCGRAGPTPRNRWRRWGGRAPPRGERPKATRRRGRESAAGAHRGISPPEALPAQGRSRGTTRDDDGLAPPPSRGSRPPPPPPPEPQPARGEHSPAAHRRPPPPRPSRARGSPPRPPRSGLPRALLRPGTPPARQRPGDDTHVRRGEAGSGPDRGRERGRSHARDEGEDEAGGSGEGPASTHGGGRGTGTRAPPRGPDDKGRARGRAPRNTSAGPHRHPHARAVPRRLGRRPAPAIPGALNPEARHPGDDALERGGPDRDRTPPPAAAQGARAGATGPSSPPAGGAGEAEADRASRPDTAPLPPGLTPRGPAARTRPPTCRTPGGAQRDPPPTRRGEARAAVGNERHTAPPRGRRTQLPPLPRRAGEFCSAHVLWQSPRWPLRTREGQRLGAPRATLGTPTPPWRGPEGDTGLRETTPPLGLRHLRDDLERSRGTAEGHTRHARTPAWGAQRGGGGTALPATGRAARRAHAEKAKREQSAVSEDQRRPLTPRGKGQQETEDQGQRPHTQPLPSSPSLMGSGGEDKRGAPRTDREERTRSLGTPVPRLARLRLGPGEHDHTTSIRGAKGDRPVRVSGRGFGFDVQKEHRRQTRQRGASHETSGPRPGTAPGAQTVLDGAPRTARAGPHLPTDWDSGSRRGVSQSRVRRPRPTRARRRVERALPGHPRKQGPVHPRLRTRQDFDKEKAWVPGDASGDRTPTGGTAHAPPPVNPRVPTSGARRGKHLGQEGPEGPDPGAPSGDLQATVRAGPHLRSGAEGEAHAPEGGPGGVRTAEPESRRSGQGRPSPCPPRRPGPGRVRAVRLRGRRGTGRCWSTRSGRPASRLRCAATVTLLRNLENQSPATAGLSLGLGATGTVAASVAGV
ncbi:collagen, type I, alpha 1b-like [Ovis canadensis]|uniref:collagen, type I, alpha 1b-like n=1 Tax=Ovis canadensis TaxID=37174 RepID=UPI003751DB12